MNKSIIAAPFARGLKLFFRFAGSSKICGVLGSKQQRLEAAGMLAFRHQVCNVASIK
jgi:hypothetical protein